MTELSDYAQNYSLAMLYVAQNISKARDGDGDGFVNDGTLRMRPVRPGDSTPISRRLRPRVATHTEDGESVDEISDVDFNTLTDKQKQTALDKVIKGLPGFKGLTADQVIDRMVGNIIRVHDSIPQSERERTALWYRAAHRLAESLGKEHNFSPEAVSAVLASLSPNFNWDQNIVQAKLLLEIHSENPTVDAATIEKVNKVVRATNKARKAAEKKAGKRSAQGYLPLLDAEPGQQLNSIEADGQAKAVLYRVLWEQKYPKGLRAQPQMVDADGYIVDDSNLKSIKFSGQSYMFLANAIDIMDNPTQDTVEHRLGDGLKVRSFFNNIAFPDDPHDDVTVDVHAGSITMAAPYAGKKRPQAIIGNTTTEGQLVRVLTVEAYRRAAEKLGYEFSNQLQSVTWEGWRWSNTQSLTRSNATKDLFDQLRQVWIDVDNGDADIDDAYAVLDQLLELKKATYKERGVPEYV